MYTISKICDLIRNEWSFFSESYYDLILKRVIKILNDFEINYRIFKDRESKMIITYRRLRQAYDLTIASVYKDNQTCRQ